MGMFCIGVDYTVIQYNSSQYTQNVIIYNIMLWRFLQIMCVALIARSLPTRRVVLDIKVDINGVREL